MSADLAALRLERDALVDDVLHEYPCIARELVSLLERIAKSNTDIWALNTRLADAGRADERLVEVERELFPDARTRMWSLGMRVALPLFSRNWAPSWNAVAIDVAEAPSDAA